MKYSKGLVLFCIAVIFLKFPLTSSLWLDESMTYWVIKDGFRELVDRSFAHQGQPFFYVVNIWIITKLFGVSEFSMRIFSVVCAALSLLVIYKLISKYSNRDLALWSTLLCASYDYFQVSAVSARPYSFGLFLSLIALYTRGSISVLFLVLAFYAHHTFLGVLLPMLLIWRYFEKDRYRWFHFSLCLLIVPGLIQLYRWHFLSEVYVHSKFPRFLEVILTYAPLYFIVYFIFGIIVARIYGPIKFISPLTRTHLKVFLIWYIVPPLAFYLLSLVAGNSLYQVRWFLWFLPSLAVLLTNLLMSVVPEDQRQKLLIVFLFLLFTREIQKRWEIEDWVGAVAALNKKQEEQEAPVLFYSGLSETGIGQWFLDRSMDDFFRGPLYFYRARGTIIPLPRYTKDLRGEEFGDRFFLLFADHKLVGTEQRVSDTYIEYFRGYDCTNVLFRKFPHLLLECKHPSL